MRRLLALFALFALVPGVARAADDVSIGMVRLPTPATGKIDVALAPNGAMRNHAVDNGFVRAAR